MRGDATSSSPSPARGTGQILYSDTGQEKEIGSWGSWSLNRRLMSERDTGDGSRAPPADWDRMLRSLGFGPIQPNWGGPWTRELFSEIMHFVRHMTVKHFSSRPPLCSCLHVFSFALISQMNCVSLLGGCSMFVKPRGIETAKPPPPLSSI